MYHAAWCQNPLMRQTVVILCVVLSAALAAEYVRIEVQNVPVDRLAANLSRQVKEWPAGRRCWKRFRDVCSRRSVSVVGRRL